ncbi:MAG: acyltransferase [Alphaproteobacteria bacterium]|nr:acyltransferase [Alphaproteobacteria bacterium]MCL2504647.1 acyltransferase [Alphaproteobacteria bacterium]
MQDKINSIQLLRVILTVLVILDHYAPSYVTQFLLPGSHLFFVIGGFFLYFVALRAKEHKTSIIQYMKKRWARIIPPAFAVLVIALFMGLLQIEDMPAYLTLTHQVVFDVTNVTPFWYISAFFWSQVIVFAILTAFRPTLALIILGTIGLISVIILFQHEALWVWQGHIFGFLNPGLLRGLFGLTLGVTAAVIVQKRGIKSAKKPYLGVLEIALLIAFIASYMSGPYIVWSGTNYQILLLTNVLIFVPLMILFVQSKGWISAFLNRQAVFEKIAIYAYPAFISQEVMVHPFHGKFDLPGWLECVFIVAAPFLFAVVYVHLIEPGAKFCWKQFRSKIY